MECQKHDDYQESIRWFLNYIQEYAKHGRTAAEAGVDKTSSTIKVCSLSQNANYVPS